MLLNKGGFGTDQIANIEIIIAPSGQVNTINASTRNSGIVSLNVDLGQNRLTVNNIPRLGTLNFQVFNFNNVFGTVAEDRIVGNNFNNTIDGSGSNDSLFGGGGNDLLIGSSGNDVVVGDAGNDVNLSNL